MTIEEVLDSVPKVTNLILHEDDQLPNVIPVDGILVERADGTIDFIDGYGQYLKNVHALKDCSTRNCAVHDPSDHVMRRFPLRVRIPGPFDIKPLHMERICDHGVGHPDPDDMLYWIERGDESMGVHGCDGCCGLVQFVPDPEPDCDCGPGCGTDCPVRGDEDE